MIVAGFGFRGGATTAALVAAYQAAGGGADALATAEDKAAHGVFRALGVELGLPLIAVPLADLSPDASPSPHVPGRYHNRSLAEAAALAAAGPGARLLGPRVTSPDGMATAALAEGRPE